MGASNSSPARTILVEFGVLTDDQQALIDLHSLRAVGTDLSMDSLPGGVVIEFLLRDYDTPDAAYDDIRGWAIGNGLPVRGLVDAV